MAELILSIIFSGLHMVNSTSPEGRVDVKQTFYESCLRGVGSSNAEFYKGQDPHAIAQKTTTFCNTLVDEMDHHKYWGYVDDPENDGCVAGIRMNLYDVTRDEATRQQKNYCDGHSDTSPIAQAPKPGDATYSETKPGPAKTTGS